MKKILLGFIFIVMIYNHSFANENYIFQANNQETLGGFFIGNNGEITYKVIDNILGKTCYIKGGIKLEYFTNVWGFKYLNNNNYIYFANDENGKLYYVYNGIKSIGYDQIDNSPIYSNDLNQYGFFVKKDGYYLPIINGTEGKKTENTGKIAFGNNNYAYSIIENGKVYIIKNGEYFEENYGKQYDGNNHDALYLDILTGKTDNTNGIAMKSKVGYEKAFGLKFSNNGDFLYNIGINCNGMFCDEYGFIKNGDRLSGMYIEPFFSNNGKDFYYKRLYNDKVELYKNSQLVGSYDSIGDYVFSNTDDLYIIVKNGNSFYIVKNGYILNDKKYKYIKTIYLTTNNELIYIAINDNNKSIIIKDNIKIGEYDYIDLNIKLNKSDIFYIVKNNINDLNNSTEILYKNGEKIDEGKYITNLNIYGDYYFYIKYEKNDLYSLFINGKEQKKYTGSDFGIQMSLFDNNTIPIILNDFLYFYNNGNLVSINLNKINENIENNSNIETEKTETTPIQETPKTTQANPQLDKILAPFFERTDKKGDEIAKNTYKTVISKIDIVLQKKLSVKNKNILNYLKEKLEEKIK